jgi:hypothetical protein
MGGLVAMSRGRWVSVKIGVEEDYGAERIGGDKNAD